MPSDMLTAGEPDELLARQQRLRHEAAQVSASLDLRGTLGSVGDPVLVGSAALGLMAWRDLDMTVVCRRLDERSVLAAGMRLAAHPDVHSLRYRDDTGRWNTEPERYPDGLYLGLRYQPARHAEWNLDIWFVDDPARQPDLAHLRTLPDRLTPDARVAILRIKTAWQARPEYGVSVRSWHIYTAVLDDHVSSLEEFDSWLAGRNDT